ncbi:MAG: hypothetical protein JWO91_1929 [Acidobacteriaceae bacterium]|jgi:hypothetical protein|nr:hypothetical protein [Acidobacteriaceae bacterium]
MCESSRLLCDVATGVPARPADIPTIVISSNARNLLFANSSRQQIPRSSAPRNDKSEVFGQIAKAT